MTAFQVTKRGNILEDGTLKNENLIGLAVESHLVPYSYTKTEPTTQMQSLETGVLTRLLVLWEGNRIPTYEDPNDVEWTEHYVDDFDEDDEDLEDETDDGII